MVKMNGAHSLPHLSSNDKYSNIAMVLFNFWYCLSFKGHFVSELVGSTALKRFDCSNDVLR